MSASVPARKKLLDLLPAWPVARRWIRRLAIAAAILSLIGYFSNPSVSPLMCKVYG